MRSSWMGCAGFLNRISKFRDSRGRPRTLEDIENLTPEVAVVDIFVKLLCAITREGSRRACEFAHRSCVQLYFWTALR